MIDLARRIDIWGARIDPGLTDSEFSIIESRFGFRFPDDLREFLAFGLPVGERSPDWRNAAADGDAQAQQRIQQSLDWPLNGMLFDIEQNSFWDPQWGAQPRDIASARRIATDAVRAAPVLIPIYSHRYLPAEPSAAGNPVFSVWQTDIIIYGRDLMSYFRCESGEKDESLRSGARPIRCWTRWMQAEWED